LEEFSTANKKGVLVSYLLDFSCLVEWLYSLYVQHTKAVGTEYGLCVT